MPIPVIVWIIGAVVVAIVGGVTTVVLWDDIVVAIKGKRLAVLGARGVGKTHLAAAIAAEACQREHRVLFSSAADIVNTLSEAIPANAL